MTPTERVATGNTRGLPSFDDVTDDLAALQVDVDPVLGAASFQRKTGARVYFLHARSMQVRSDSCF